MCVRYLGFILLIWFPGALHAQSAAQSCSAPRLDGGFFAPKQQTYSDGTKLSYTCVEGRKPAVKGWWATSTCHSGEWSPEPQCIDEKACLPPDIPNAKYIENRSGWYRDGHKIRITCDEGYEPKYRHVTAKCNGGTWTSLPVCEKSINACGEPPKIPHAVIIHQEYQEVFAANSEVQYECEDGYTVEGTDTTKSIFCIYGNWTEGPTCKSSSTSGSNERTSRPQITTVDHCGAYPNVPNGDVVERDQTYIKFQCNAFYTQVGLGTVVCYSDGTWSQLPICKEAFCVLDPAEHVGANFRLSGVEYLKEGEEKHIACIQQDYSSRVQCTNGKIHFTQCMETEPGAGQNGSAEVGSAGVNTTSTGSGIHPEGGGSRPGTGHGGSAGGGHTTSTGGGTKPVGGGSRPGTGHGGSAGGGHTTSTGGGTKPVGGGSRPGTGHGGSAGSASSSEEKETQLQITTITTCGNHPVVPNGDVVGNNPMFLRYQCAAFYKQTGPERVECYSNGKWSETPTCKPAFCSLDTGDYSELIPVGVKYIKDGEKARFECVHQDEWWTTHYSVVRCNNGRMRRSRCCDWWDLKRDIC
ncbi:complement decay-accelerating factor transmembrane isoform-like isoform X1 [Epinephelus fuscoguttatus]|uniref:complement decay-accelerating factor transmembrane isoform-like isoform X1 n=1 Tax=Epinephelus fuscoguttatus TaxID=293821 RepID=UPI0020D117FA|nr:complement decay-accelerating factor transmembrane isoform-like isoform X1 [Epinephelus fuscoguttatus]